MGMPEEAVEQEVQEDVEEVAAGSNGGSASAQRRRRRKKAQQAAAARHQRDRQLLRSAQRQVDHHLPHPSHSPRHTPYCRKHPPHSTPHRQPAPLSLSCALPPPRPRPLPLLQHATTHPPFAPSFPQLLSAFQREQVGRQEDAAEFLLFLLDKLQEESIAIQQQLSSHAAAGLGSDAAVATSGRR